jgi:hypothetical protein
VPKYASPVPIAPRLDDARRQADADELRGDPEWTRLDITVDLRDHATTGLDIQQCRISASNFSGSELARSRIVDTVFVDCDLSGAALDESVLTRVEFRNCRMSGMILNAAKLRDVLIIECKAEMMSMRMITAQRLTCAGSLLRAADLYSGAFELTRFFDCDLAGAELSAATFTDVRLHGSDLGDIRGIGSLRNVVIDPEQMHGIALALLAAQHVDVDDEREPSPPKSR